MKKANICNQLSAHRNRLDNIFNSLANGQANSTHRKNILCSENIVLGLNGVIENLTFGCFNLLHSKGIHFPSYDRDKVKIREKKMNRRKKIKKEIEDGYLQMDVKAYILFYKYTIE